jgi:two-component system, sensor histidine kinase and response regulator
MHTDSPILDKNIIMQLIAETSRECMPLMLTAFCEELRKRQALLTEALINSDLAELAEQAHAVKSCSGTFGANSLYLCAKTLEDNARSLAFTLPDLIQDAEKLLGLLTKTEQQYLSFITQEFD